MGIQNPEKFRIKFIASQAPDRFSFTYEEFVIAGPFSKITSRKC
jgi:hypothetical protein